MSAETGWRPGYGMWCYTHDQHLDDCDHTAVSPVSVEGEDERGSSSYEATGPIGAGTPHARMEWFWQRMEPHEKLVAELTGWNPIRSDYAWEVAIADAFDVLAAASPSSPTGSERVKAIGDGLDTLRRHGLLRPEDENAARAALAEIPTPPLPPLSPTGPSEGTSEDDVRLDTITPERQAQLREATRALKAGEPCPRCGMRHADPLDFLDGSDSDDG